MNREGTWIHNGRVHFVKLPAGNYIQTTRVEHGAGSPATVEAMMRPGQQRVINNDDLHISLGHTKDANARGNAKQMGTKVTGIRRYCEGCGEAMAIRRAVPMGTKVKSGRPLQQVFIDLTGPAERGLVSWWWITTPTSEGQCFCGTRAVLLCAAPLARVIVPSKSWRRPTEVWTLLVLKSGTSSPTPSSGSCSPSLGLRSSTLPLTVPSAIAVSRGNWC